MGNKSDIWRSGRMRWVCILWELLCELLLIMYKEWEKIEFIIGNYE